jgi:hypothetical protein
MFGTMDYTTRYLSLDIEELSAWPSVIIGIIQKKRKMIYEAV